MIIAIDTETQGLDARKFLIGSLVKENGSSKFFYKPEEMWKYIIDLGYAERKRGKNLIVYAHNMEYDFYAIANLTSYNLKWKCTYPFIVDYVDVDSGERIIRFLDSMSIFPMSLKKVGDIIGLPKLEMPEELIITADNSKKITMNMRDITALKKYCLRDSEICLKSVKFIKEKLKRDGINVKYAYSISQISIQYYMNWLRKFKEGKYNDLFIDNEKKRMRWSQYPWAILQAYRGGRNECFRLGKVSNVNYIDINSLYGYCASEMRFPNLETEEMIYKPLNGYKIEQILGKLGVSKAMVKVAENDNIGLLPARIGFKGTNHFGKNGDIIIGVYTNLELMEAYKNGYKIIDIEWSIVYEDSEKNPFSEYIPDMYIKRLDSGEMNKSFDSWFYKQMQNRCIGKLAQHTKENDMFFDSVEKVWDYQERGYEVIDKVGLNYLYRLCKRVLDKQKVQKKNYFVPIIPTLVNAQARIFLYRELKKIPKKDLIYCDTDSILFINDHFNKYNIGNGLGQFKIEGREKECMFYGRKTYSYGEQVKASGIPSSGIDAKSFNEGILKFKKMKSIKSAEDITEVGAFQEIERNLAEQLIKANEDIAELENRKVYIDNSVDNINYFINSLEQMGNVPLIDQGGI